MDKELFDMQSQYLSSIAGATSAVVCSYLDSCKQDRVSMSEQDLSGLITMVRERLTGGVPYDMAEAQAMVAPQPLVPIDQTVFADGIISLEDGKKYKSLKRHIGKFNMTPEQYRAKWGLPADYPMVCAEYSVVRSMYAKEMGLGKRDKGEA